MIRSLPLFRSLTGALAALACVAGAAVATSPAAHADGAGFVTVTDDTGTFRASIPDTWDTWTHRQPYWGFWEVVPSGEYPTITAVPPTTSTVGSSLTIQAFPLSATGDVLDSFYGDYGVDCDVTNLQESAFGSGGGTLVGRRWDWYGCYAYARHTVIADYGTNYTIAIDFFSETPADSMSFETILASVQPTGTAVPTPPPTTAPAAPITFPWSDFRSVPRLGAEGVRGTGCGSAGQVGDVIPDGWWSGFTSWPGDGRLGIDLVCVFSGTGAQQVLADADDNILDANPDFLVVNNNPRVRTMPTNPSILAAYSGADIGGGTCVPSAPADITTTQPNMAWVHISGGLVDYVFYDCPRAPTPAPQPQPQPSNLPPAYPSGDAFSVWPYGEFWNVPQLGSEPVRGSGCGSQGEIGGTIPDGLWAGYVSLDGATDQLWVDLLCIYYGDSAQSVLAGGSANIVLNDPGYLIVNNNDQRRMVPNNLQLILSSANDESGRCVPQGAGMPAGDHMTAPVYEIDAYGANQAWIRIADGAATWLIYGCDTGFQPGG